jgi:hypothetical protein
MEALLESIEQCDGTQCGDRGTELFTLRNDGLAVDRFAICPKGDHRLDAEVAPEWVEEFEESRGGKQVAVVSVGGSGC